jgi:hypothetical protein
LGQPVRDEQGLSHGGKAEVGELGEQQQSELTHELSGQGPIAAVNAEGMGQAAKTSGAIARGQHNFDIGLSLSYRQGGVGAPTLAAISE